MNRPPLVRGAGSADAAGMTPDRRTPAWRPPAALRRGRRALLALAVATLPLVPAQGRPGGLAAAPMATAEAVAPAAGLAGREVWSMDEVRLGRVTPPIPRCQQRDATPILPDPGLGLGTTPFAVPAAHLLEAGEGRLVLTLTPREIRAAASAAGCPPQ